MMTSRAPAWCANQQFDSHLYCRTATATQHTVQVDCIDFYRNCNISRVLVVNNSFTELPIPETLFTGLVPDTSRADGEGRGCLQYALKKISPNPVKARGVRRGGGSMPIKMRGRRAARALRLVCQLGEEYSHLQRSKN